MVRNHEYLCHFVTSRNFCVVLTFFRIVWRISIGAIAADWCTNPDSGGNANFRLPLDVVRVRVKEPILSYECRMIPFEKGAGRTSWEFILSKGKWRLKLLVVNSVPTSSSVLEKK